MKLATIFLIASIVHVCAATMAQQVTLKKDNLTYKQLFKEVRRQTGYSILWETDKFNANEKISVNFYKSSLKEVFDDVLNTKGYPYLIEETTIIIQNQSTEKANSQFFKEKHAAIDVTGRIVDENGQPIGGASVLIKSTGKGISTAADGTFTLANVEEKAIILIKCIGFDSKEIPASRDLGLVRLKIATNDLDAVQIQAYGTTSKRLTTSNITTIRAEDIEKQPISNPLLALQGRVPGLVVTPVSGFSGGTVTVRIQGYNSMNGGNNPFYVVDWGLFQKWPLVFLQSGHFFRFKMTTVFA